MNTRPESEKITVYYDGSCPSCIRDRKIYEKLSGEKGKTVEWFDITDKEPELIKLGIDPKLALQELHIKANDDQIIREMDAYILLLHQTFWLKPFALILQLRMIKSFVAKMYHYLVNRRLRRSGRD